MPVQTVSNAALNPFGGTPAVEIPADAKAMGAFLVAEYASDEGDHEAALKGYEDAVAADPTNSTLRVRLATLYVRDGRLKEALTRSMRRSGTSPIRLTPACWRPESAVRSATMRPPRRTTSRSCRTSPQNQEAYLYLGTLYAKRGDYVECRADFSAADRARSQFVPWLLLRRPRDGGGRRITTTADEYYQKALDLNPHSELVLLDLAMLREFAEQARGSDRRTTTRSSR